MNGAAWHDGVEEAAAHRVPGSPAQRSMLLALLLVAAALRLWDLPHMPYTHDEISALVRIFPTLGETVRTGVIAMDTHPPGVQVFEWVWTKLFGMSEAAVKLPFILLSIAALFFLYRFAFAWAGGQVALVITALLATLQYTVMYGQIARPYAVGLFTTALMADQLTRYLGSGSRRALVGFAMAAVLSAYTHHFAMMLAVFMAATGLFLVGQERIKPYLAACGIAILLYLPNVPIFLGQLGQKGLDGWLARPTALWIPEYLWWLAHCTWAMAAAWILLLACSAALKIRHGGTTTPIWAMALLWGLGPLLVGYGYSLWRSPVLQYSMLLFSFPYLLLGLLAGLRHLPRRWMGALLSLIVLVSTATLIEVRKHYEIFYRSRYEAITKGILEAASTPGRAALVDTPDEVVRFYLQHWHADAGATPYTNLRDMPADRVDSVLRATDASSVFLGFTPGSEPERAAQVQAAFPFLLERHDLEEGQTFLFGASPAAARRDDHTWSSMATPEAIQGNGWNLDPDLPLHADTATRGALRRWDLTGREFGIALEIPVYQISSHDNDVIEASMDVAEAHGGSLRLVAELKVGKESRFYRSTGLPATRTAGTLVCAIPLADLPGHGHGQQLLVYAWNEGGGVARISSVEVKVRSGNPWLYGFFQPLKGPLTYP
ncbi:MAG TPA: glycosyltransferase family 39 protein [Flavobacteriales bacterium]|nr:glycosyltransferase family 39 protein [Flavobacteriales bacterium]